MLGGVRGADGQSRAGTCLLGVGLCARGEGAAGAGCFPKEYGKVFFSAGG